MNDDLEKLFSHDGLIHTAPPMRKKKRYEPNTRRMNAIRCHPRNSTTYEVASVCLKCTRDDCDGEQKCFKLRHELMKRRKTDRELNAALEDAESEIDAMISEFNAAVKAINKEI